MNDNLEFRIAKALERIADALDKIEYRMWKMENGYSILVHIGFIGLIISLGAITYSVITSNNIMELFFPVCLISGVLIMVGLYDSF